MALIFREHLPNGVKYVKFVSQDGLGEQIVETREENRSTLSAIIPGTCPAGGRGGCVCKW